MRRALIVLTIIAVSIPIFSAVRLTYQVNGNPLPVAWSAHSFPVQYTIDRRVAAASPQAKATIDRAFEEWTRASDTSVRFAAAPAADIRAGKDGTNSVTLVDNLFKGQNVLAMTTNWHDDSGRIMEADIQIDAGIFGEDYDSQLLIEHEVGHLLGLDHSGVLTSVMYPWVSRGRPTALDSDDRNMISALYPRVEPLAGATLQGEVRGNEGGIFAAQVVAVNEEGEPVATALSQADGSFVLKNVPAGSYRIYAEPLDGPMSVDNLSGIWRQAKVVSFPTAFLGGGPLRVEEGKVYGNLEVSSVGAPVQLNPRFVGGGAAGVTDLTFSATPVMVRGGQSLQLGLGGDGFTSGMTTFEVLNPGFHRVSDFRYSGNYVSATFTVAANAPVGSSVVLVHSGNQTAALTGALRVDGASGRTRVARR